MFREWAKVSSLHDKTDLAGVVRVTEVTKAFLRSSMEDFIRDLEDQSLLIAYSGDSTPIGTSRRVESAGADSSTVVRKMAGTNDFYIHNMFASVLNPLGGLQSRGLLEEPRPMTSGKKMGAEFAIGRQFVVRPRSLGHRGIEVVHCCWDRAHFSGIQTLWRQFWAHHCGEDAARACTLDPMETFSLTWVTCTACAAHDGHNALKWGDPSRYSDKRFMKDVFIAMVSLCNCSKRIIDYLNVWLPDVLEIVDIEGCPGERELRDLWEAVGVPERAVDDIVRVRMHWRGEKLCVAGGASGSEEEPMIHAVCHILFQIWSFRRFTESRWASIGPAARSAMAGRLSGLDHLVRAMLDDKEEGNYLLSGYRRMSPEVAEFLGVTALYTRPAESHVRSVLEDGRVAKTLDTLVENVQEQWEYLNDLALTTWTSFADACGVTMDEYRHLVLSRALASIAFLEFRVYSVAKALPYSLLRGDIDENLAALQRGPDVEEPIAAKIQYLLRRGESVEWIKGALELLRHTVWSGAVAEQQHASAAVVARYHPLIEHSALVSRSALHAFRKLLPSQSKKARKLQRFRAELERLDRRRPRRVGTWQMHCKEAVEATTKWKAEGRAIADAKVHLRVLKKAKVLYDRMPLQRRQRLAAAAQAETEEKEAAIAKRREELLTLMGELATEVREESIEDEPPSLLSCKFTEEDLQTMNRMLLEDRFAGEPLSEAAQ